MSSFFSLSPAATTVLAASETMAVTIPVLMITAMTVSFWGYAKLASRVRKGEGRLWLEPFTLPDGLVVGVLSFWFASMSVLRFFAPPREPTPITNQGLLMGGLFFLTLVCLIAGFLQWRRVPLGKLLGLRPESFGKTVLQGVGYFLMAYPGILIVTALLFHFFPQETKQQDILIFYRESLINGNYRSLFLATFTALVIAPLAEEFIFRGYIFGTLRRFLSPVGAVLLSALFFALIHDSATALIPLFLLAICLALAYEKTGSLWVPIIMHVIFNAVTLGWTFLMITYNL